MGPFGVLEFTKPQPTEEGRRVGEYRTLMLRSSVEGVNVPHKEETDLV